MLLDCGYLDQGNVLEIPIHRGVCDIRVATGGGQHASDGRVPQPWHIRSDVLHLEEVVRRPGWQRDQAVAQLEEENARLKRVVADLTLDKHILQEVIRKKV